MRPILFNTEMVRAILEGRKTVTRRVIKGNTEGLYAGKCLLGTGLFDEKTNQRVIEPPYKVNDILYVRETWRWLPCFECGRDIWSEPPCLEGKFNHKYGNTGCYAFKADIPDDDTDYFKWKPSIHMPKEAARIFLRVTDVRVERLLNITEEQAWKEGIVSECARCKSYNSLECQECANEHEAYNDFMDLWDSTIKKDQLNKYGCEANPNVWVIEFERVEREEVL